MKSVFPNIPALRSNEQRVFSALRGSRLFETQTFIKMDEHKSVGGGAAVEVINQGTQAFFFSEDVVLASFTLN